MATLSIFTENFTGRLRTSIPEHLEEYQGADNWAGEFAAGTKWELPTTVDPNLPAKTEIGKLLALPTAVNFKDLDNSIRLHKAFQTLTPVQARDPRLWTRLSHVEFWAYMRSRWPAERHLPDQAKAVRYIDEHYFVSRTEGRALLHNGIARLWWYSHVTFDDKRQNPYELTGILLHTLDITKNMLERSMGRSKVVLVAFLEFLSENPELLAKGDAARDKVRKLSRSLNVLGGVALLDCFSSGSLKAHLTKELARTRASEPATIPVAPAA